MKLITLVLLVVVPFIVLVVWDLRNDKRKRLDATRKVAPADRQARPNGPNKAFVDAEAARNQLFVYAAAARRDEAKRDLERIAQSQARKVERPVDVLNIESSAHGQEYRAILKMQYFGPEPLKPRVQSVRQLPPSPAPQELPAIVRVAIVDTETTGLSHTDEPVSVAAILYEVELPKGRLLREIARYYGLRQPSVPVHPRARAVHKLSDSQLAGKTLDMEALGSIIGAADVLIAHNAKFDSRMLEPIFPGIRQRNWRCSIEHVSWPPILSNAKLDTICLHFSILRPATHDALADCHALAESLFQRTGKTDRSRTYMGMALVSKRGASWQGSWAS